MGVVGLTPGTLFGGDFRVKRSLSQGGMGSVYVVEQLSTGAERALKLMHGQFATDKTMRRRFEAEARIGARIESAHVVHVVAAGIDPVTDTPWLVMELLVGEDLESYLRRIGPLPRSEVATIMEQLCHGVGAAHAAGIVHRDLKPQNVFLAQVARVGTPYEVKVLDFGIAKITAELSETTGNTGTMGTPAWMAPEQTELKATIVPATDVWAIGLIAFRLLTGKHYWRAANVRGGPSETLLREILVEPLEPASTRGVEYERGSYIPKGFDAWFERCIARNHRARFPDARAAWEALAPIVDERREAPPDTARWSKPPSFSTASERAPARGPSGPSGGGLAPAAREASAPPRRAKALLFFAGMSVALLSGAAAIAWRSHLARKAAPMAPQPTASTTTATALPVEGNADATAPPLQTEIGELVDGQEKVLVPGGTFAMGSSNGEDDERPVHTVTVQPFEIDRTEITVAQYRACVTKGRCSAPRADEGCTYAAPDRETHPVTCVDWTQASTYCRAHGKRLPSEEEWELAARGPHGRTWPWGSTPPGKQLCWNGEGNLEGKGRRTGTCAAGTPAGDTSPFGVLGMAGNVSEWTASRYCPYPIANCANPQRVVRGATWSDFAAASFRTTYRTRSLPSEQSATVGFRCARTP